MRERDTTRFRLELQTSRKLLLSWRLAPWLLLAAVWLLYPQRPDLLLAALLAWLLFFSVCRRYLRQGLGQPAVSALCWDQGWIIECQGRAIAVELQVARLWALGVYLVLTSKRDGRRFRLWLLDDSGDAESLRRLRVQLLHGKPASP